MIDWDAYRAAYPTMSYPDVVAFHDRVWELYPEQDKHSTEHLEAFFDRYPATSVVEVGGWRGEAAAYFLGRQPAIEAWHNYELCRQAAGQPATDDARYTGVWPTDWVWNLAPPRADTAVLSHVIEHVSAAQLGLLVAWLDAAGVQQAYVEAPLRNRPRRWRQSNSAHVLEIGWTDVIPLWAAHGFGVAYRDAYPPDRQIVVFAR